MQSDEIILTNKYCSERSHFETGNFIYTFIPDAERDVISFKLVNRIVKEVWLNQVLELVTN